jgi:3-hydroxyisobutyrate dehydrogenase-like beta-hydroxyacid dehydrogenase
MARRLLEAGHHVVGHNRTRAKGDSLVQAGLKWANSPRAVAEASEITFSMVTDDAALSTVCSGPDGILAGMTAGKIHVDMSTVSPRLVRDLAHQIAAGGSDMLDAPVSGSVPAAESGTMVIYVGGEASVLERVRPALEVMGQKIIHVGRNGQGTSMKIAINVGIAAQLVPLFEGVLLAERSGIPRSQALQALLESVAASPAMKYRGPFILQPPDEVWFSVALMQKDIQLALQLGRELEVPLLSAGMVNELLNAARAMGHTDRDFSAIFSVLERLAGGGGG